MAGGLFVVCGVEWFVADYLDWRPKVAENLSLKLLFIIIIKFVFEIIRLRPSND